MSKYDFSLDMNSDNSLSLIARQLEKNKTILEFGPATGRLTKYMKEELSSTVDIVEIDATGYEKAIEFARDGFLGDIESYQWEETFAGREYDYILFADVLEHLRNPEKVLKVCKKYLKDEGRMIVSIPNVAHNSVLHNLLRNEFQYNSVGLLDNTHIHLFTYHSAKAMFESVGMSLVVEDATYIEEVQNEFKYSLKDTNPIEQEVLWIHPFGRVYQFVFTAMKNDTVKIKEIVPEVKIKRYENDQTANIFWKVDGEYVEEQKIDGIEVKGRFQLEITKGKEEDKIQIPDSAKEIRLDFVENKNIIITDFIVKDEKDQVLPYSCEDAFCDCGMVVFYTKDPQILISVEEVSSIKVSGNLRWVSNEELMFLCQKYHALKQEKKELDESCKELEEYREAYHAVLNSTSWRITKPLRTMIGALKKTFSKVKPLRLAWKFFRATQRDGLACAWYLAKNKLARKKISGDIYKQWIEKNETIKAPKQELSYEPLISVVIPVYNVSEKHLTECIESVVQQSYINWELCLADDASTWECVKPVLKKYEANKQVKVVYREKNGHISAATNSAIEVATGEFIAFMDCDDVLAPNALYEMVKKLNEGVEYDFIYSDEDKIDNDGKNRHMPHFKSDWAPDTLMSYMYTSHFSMYRKSIVDELGGLRIGYEGSQDYDFTLRFMEKTRKVGHVPKVLYHWRETEGSTATSPETKPYILEAAKKAKEDALKRRGVEGSVELVEDIYQYRVNYHPTGNPLVSVIIPSKDNVKVYERCIQTLYEKTAYKNFEVIHVDNGSSEENKRGYENIARTYGVQYHYQPMNFNFSAMCNIGAKQAKGSYLLFLNDDIEIIKGDWLERMLGQAMQQHVGAVGAKLLYPGIGNIQHTGVINLSQGPVHCFANMPDDVIYDFCRNKLDFNYSAVTGACLLLSREKFDAVGGFEEELPVAYNDVDLCFKLTEQGYFNVLRNDAVLYHHESVSRGYDHASAEKMQRLTRERNKLYERHPQFYQKDCFYSQNLTQTLPDFSVEAEVREIDLKASAFDTKETILKEGKEGLISYDLNSVQVSEIIRIEGFAFLKKRRFNNLRKVKVILANESQGYSLETEKIYRGDLKNNIPHKGKIGMTGFVSLAKSDSIEKGTYRIYLKIGSKICDTKQEISCS
ncbi:MAG: glycosyltransferase [Lachnospiraceae bacterium]|nr:glycosyltransferase [Lachnospiraceae bacterium]